MPSDTAITNYPRLDGRTWLAPIQAYRTLREERRTVDRRARELKEECDRARDTIIKAMDSAPMAQCGDLMLTIKTGGAAAPAITLDNGRKIAIGEIKSLVLIDGSRVSGANIAKLYSGKSESTDLEVAG